MKTERTTKTVRFFAGLAGAMGWIVMGLFLHLIGGSEISKALFFAFGGGFAFFVGIWVFSGRFWIKMIQSVEEVNNSYSE